MRKVRCQAKLIGTIVTGVGALLMTLYKGQVINFFWSHYMHHPRNYSPADTTESGDKDWVKGSILLIIATLAWASFFILQAVTLRKYSAQLSLTALVCFMGTLQSIAVTFVMEHKASAWAIGWDMNLLAAAYAVSPSISLSPFSFFNEQILQDTTRHDKTKSTTNFKKFKKLYSISLSFK